MDKYEEKLKQYMKDHSIEGEHLTFTQSCHSVKEAALAVNGKEDEFVKNICMIDANGNLIVAIVKGEDRASTTNVAKVLRLTNKPRIATPDEILAKTGYPCGGTPSFDYEATFLIDERVMEKEVVYSGGGSEMSLVKLAPREMIKANKGKIEKIRK